MNSTANAFIGLLGMAGLLATYLHVNNAGRFKLWTVSMVTFSACATAYGVVTMTRFFLS